jgi:hypothetical protein
MEAKAGAFAFANAMLQRILASSESRVLVFVEWF